MTKAGQAFYLSSQIVLRNWTVYKKNLLANISSTFVDPVFIMLALGGGLGAYVQDVDGMSYAQFLAPGVIGVAVLFATFFETTYIVYFRLFIDQNYAAMLTTPIGPHHVIGAEFMWCALKCMGFATLVMAVLAIMGLADPFLWPVVVFIAALTSFSGASLGFIATTMVKNLDQFQTFYSFVIAPMLYISAIFFPVSIEEFAPVYWVNQINPIYHGVRLLQEVIWQRWDATEMLYHLGLLLIITAILMFIAWRRMHRKLWS